MLLILYYFRINLASEQCCKTAVWIHSSFILYLYDKLKTFCQNLRSGYCRDSHTTNSATKFIDNMAAEIIRKEVLGKNQHQRLNTVYDLIAHAHTSQTRNGPPNV